MPRDPERPRRWRSVPAVFAVSLVAISVGVVAAADGPTGRNVSIVAGAALALAAIASVALLRSRWRPVFERELSEHSAAIDALSGRRLGPAIALASGLGLFVEFTLIRWHSSAFQLFAYYKNLTLLACFLGLGIGYALGSRRLLATPLVMPALAVQFIVLYVLGYSRLGARFASPFSEQLSFSLRFERSVADLLIVYGFIALVFAGTVMTCVPLGHLASRLMARRPALASYGWNLAGSLGGVILFSILSHLRTPPEVWLATTAVGLVPFLYRSRVAMAIALVSAAAALGALAYPLDTSVVTVHSPYQVVSLAMPRGRLPLLRVSHVFYQSIADLGDESRRSDPRLSRLADYYDLPYRLRPGPESVLIVGSGTGNDVAAAVRNGAGRVDAVEIDPTILDFGRALHPEKPYDDPRVRAHVEDARTFLRRTDERYDLIVYGLLDSHSLLSGLSSVRLDSFVYTIEGFEDAREKLKPGGLVAMTFAILGPEQGRKFFLMLREAFGGLEPRVFQSENDSRYVYVTGPGLDALKAAGELPMRDVTSEFAASTTHVDVSTDDWPFPYMPVRKYPVSYMAMFGVLLALSVLFVREIVPSSGSGLDGTCFFLGAGFMLVETRAITELALTFGNTWEVVSVVVAAVMIVALLANAVVARAGSPPVPVVYGLLGAALLAGIFVTARSLDPFSPPLRKLVAAALAAAPIFFSGLAFSGEIRRRPDAGGALAANLLGAMLGGFLEYNSMYFGFRSLYWLALAMYAIAFLSALRRRPAP